MLMGHKSTLGTDLQNQELSKWRISHCSPLFLYFCFLFFPLLCLFFLSGCWTLQKLCPLGTFLSKYTLSFQQVLGITCHLAASAPSQTKVSRDWEKCKQRQTPKFQGWGGGGWGTLEGGRGLGLYVLAVRHMWLDVKEGWEFAQSLWFSEKEEATKARMWDKPQMAAPGSGWR